MPCLRARSPAFVPSSCSFNTATICSSFVRPLLGPDSNFNRRKISVTGHRYPKVGMTIEDDARNIIVNLSRGLPEYVHFLGRDAARCALRARRLNIVRDDTIVAIDGMVKNSDQTLDEAYSKAVL